MSSRQKKLIATTTAVILILALGIAGTFAASGSGDSSGNIEGQVETSIFLHDDFSKTWEDDVMDRDVYVENTGDTSLYVRMRLDEFMTYGGKKLVGGIKEQKSTWKPHVAAGTNPSECGTEIHDYFTIQMGNETGVKYKPKTNNAYDPALTEAEKTETTSAAEIVLIEDYLKAENKPDACWVLDTADGYAYWHQQLPKGKATGLILNSITNTGLIDESYYYGINAKAEAVTEMDLNAWLNGRPPGDSETGEAFDQASTNAIRFLKNLSPKYIEITEEMAANGANDFDSDNDGYLTKQENTQYEAEKGVTSTPQLGSTVSINAENFPDNALLTAVKIKDTNDDGELSKQEIEKTTSFDLSGTGITDYTGLEYFTALTELNVSNNDLTEINFLSKIPNLTSLNISNNNLTSLSLAKGALTKILEAVVEGHAAAQLTYVNCSNNKLTSLNLSSAPGLKTLNCKNNRLTKLDISGNPAIGSIIADNQTTTVNVTYDKSIWKYKGGSSLFTTGMTFGESDVACDSATGGLVMDILTDGKTSTYRVPLMYNGSEKGTLSGTITFTGTIFVPATLKEKVGMTPTGGTVQLANKDGSEIEWIVYNKTTGEADLIVKNTVENRQFHTTTPYPGWLNSDVRKWLNAGTSGYKSRLSDEMKAAIKAQNLTTANAHSDWSSPTASVDEIYLLTETGKGSGKVGKTIGTVDGTSGSVGHTSVSYAGGGIRPALTISLN